MEVQDEIGRIDRPYWISTPLTDQVTEDFTDKAELLICWCNASTSPKYELWMPKSHHRTSDYIMYIDFTMKLDALTVWITFGVNTTSYFIQTGYVLTFLWCFYFFLLVLFLFLVDPNLWTTTEFFCSSHVPHCSWPGSALLFVQVLSACICLQLRCDCRPLEASCCFSVCLTWWEEPPCVSLLG